MVLIAGFLRGIQVPLCLGKRPRSIIERPFITGYVRFTDHFAVRLSYRIPSVFDIGLRLSHDDGLRLYLSMYHELQFSSLRAGTAVAPGDIDLEESERALGYIIWI